MVHRALGPAHRFLDCLLGGGHYRSQAHPTRLDQLPLGGPTLSSTVANWRKLLGKASSPNIQRLRRTPASTLGQTQIPVCLTGRIGSNLTSDTKGQRFF